MNDIAPKEASSPRNRVRSRPQKTLPKNHKDENIIKDFSAFPWLVDHVLNEFKAKTEQKSFEQKWEEWMQKVITAWKDDMLVTSLKEKLVLTRNELRLQQRRFIVMVLPEKHDLTDPDQYNGPRTNIIELIKSLNIEYIDTYQHFSRRTDLNALFLQGDAIHLTRNGHMIIAEILAKFLISEPVTKY